MMIGLDPRTALDLNTAALARSHRDDGRSDEAKAFRRGLYAERDEITAAIAAGRAEKREREQVEG